MNYKTTEFHDIPDDLIALAGDVLDGVENAKIWLTQVNVCLDGKRPIDLIGTEEGKAAVIELLGRIEHGIFS